MRSRRQHTLKTSLTTPSLITSSLISLIGALLLQGCVSASMGDIPYYEVEGEPDAGGALGGTPQPSPLTPPLDQGPAERPDMWARVDMSPVQLDMAPLEPDMAPLEPDMAPLEPDMAPPEPDMAPPEPDMAPPPPEPEPDCGRCLGHYTNCRAMCMNTFDAQSGGNGYAYGDCISFGGRDENACCECHEPMPFKACSRCLVGASSCVEACGGQANSYCQTPFSTNPGDCCNCVP